ncbi:Tax-2 [Aphelenchoides besseyi]|nr:Tax-2 [Aphelenchoides besseyi]
MDRNQEFRHRLDGQWRQARTRPLDFDGDSSLSEYGDGLSVSSIPSSVPPMSHHSRTSESREARESTAEYQEPKVVIHEPPPSNSPRSIDSPKSIEGEDRLHTGRDTDISSRLSFIVKEKLHEFAKDLRRRTSQVRDDVVRELTPEATEEVSDTGSNRIAENTSLMSLIGFEVANEEDAPKWSHVSFLVVFRSRCFSVQRVLYWMICDYVCDFIYVLDLLAVKPRLTFMRGGITVKDSKEMRSHYLHSNLFKLDLISLIPTDLAYFYTGPVAAWRAVRLLKLPSFWEFFDLLDSSFSNPYVVRITKTFSYMIYIIHCNSCVYYMLSAWQAFGQIAYRYRNQWYLNKWVYNNQGNAYIRCFYFTSAVATSTGNNPAPTNVIEYIYMTFSWMMGVFVFALLLGQIRDIVSNANKNNEEFRTTMDKALGECKRLELPEQLTSRVRAWFLYTWEQQKTLDEKKLVKRLPLKLQTDLALSVHFNTLSKVQLFQDADRALLRDLVLKLQPVIFLPGDMVCRKGDVGKEMYIVNQGILEVVGGENNTQVFATLVEGSVFGEISLLAIGGNNRRTANIRSKGYSTLFVLSKEDLNDVIRDYPDAQQLLKRKARKMLKKDEKKDDVDPKQARQELKEKCRVSADIRTPKMLEAVAKILPANSKTKKQLEIAMKQKARPPLKRWSTIPIDEFSDISDVEMPGSITTRSLN